VGKAYHQAIRSGGEILMKRLFLGVALAALVLIAIGCRSTTRPGVFVSGTVYSADGHPVFYAKVKAGALSTFTNEAGQYRIRAPRVGAELHLDASDGWDPRQVYATTCSGTARVLVGDHGASADIVLDACGPI
jgi:hypothetical protein